MLLFTATPEEEGEERLGTLPPLPGWPAGAQLGRLFTRRGQGVGVGSPAGKFQV